MSIPQTVLNMNHNSALLKELSKYPYNSDHVQELTINKPNNYRSIINLYPESSTNPTLPSAGTKYKFIIDDVGFLRNMCLKTELRSAGDNDVTMQPRLGSRLFSNIELRQHNKVIFSCNSSYLLCRINDSEKDKQQHLINITEVTPAWKAATDVEVRSPLFAWIFDNSNSNILLDFNKNLELIVEYNSGVIYDSPPTKFDVSLVLFRVCYEPEFIHEFIKKNYDNNTSIYGYDVRRFSKNLVLNDTSSSVYLESPYLVTSIHCNIILQNYGVTTVNRIVLRIGDKVVLDVDRNMNLLSNKQVPGDSGLNSFSYYFGDKERQLGMSGALDFYQQPYELTAYFDAIPLALATLSVNLEYVNILDIDKETGKFNTQLIH